MNLQCNTGLPVINNMNLLIECVMLALFCNKARSMRMKSVYHSGSPSRNPPSPSLRSGLRWTSRTYSNWCSRQESNLHLSLRRGLFYPLNYRSICSTILILALILVILSLSKGSIYFFAFNTTTSLPSTGILPPFTS